MPLGVGEFKFCIAEQCSRPSNASPCPHSGLDQAWAEFYITSLQRNPALLLALRAFVQQHGFGVGRHVSDQAVIRWMAGQLISGRIRICSADASAVAQTVGDTGSTSTPASAPADTQTQKAFPLAARQQTPSRSSGPTSEQTLFPADVEMAALAQTLKNAAQTGAPFCEECQRAAQGG